MIYIDENSTDVMLPKVSFDRAVKIRFTNQLTHSEFDYPREDTGTTTYYVIDFEALKNLFEVGQYDYKILNENDEVISEGILQFGNFESQNKAHEAEPVNIIQYNG